MRRILVDHGRARLRDKRGGGAVVIEIGEAIDRVPAKGLEVVALDDALHGLAKLDAQQCRVVEMRFFGGLSLEETAEALGISRATVHRDWVTARAWLLREMSRAG